jgi:solute carrier family 25 carnitine/acylcarnitine transporter 20/29
MGGYGIGKQWAENNDDDDNDNGGGGGGGGGTVLIPVFIGGCTGGIVQSFLMSPVEYIKVQSQINPSVQHVVKTTSQQLVANHHNITKGLSATLWRDGIPHGVWFMSYEWCKTTLEERTKSETHRQLSIPLFSGAFAATTAWVRTKKKK